MIAGQHIWKPRRPWPNFRGKSTDSSTDYAILLLPSDSTGFRQPPPSSVSSRFGSLLALASVGDMFACISDGAGRAYPETQHAMGQFRGSNIPMLLLLMEFPSFRQMPSASAIFRQPPLHVACGPCVLWQHVWGPGRCRTRIIGNLTAPGPNSGGEAADSRVDHAVFLIPSASVPGRIWPLPPSPTSL